MEMEKNIYMLKMICNQKQTMSKGLNTGWLSVATNDPDPDTLLKRISHIGSSHNDQAD